MAFFSHVHTICISAFAILISYYAPNFRACTDVAVFKNYIGKFLLKISVYFFVLCIGKYEEYFSCFKWCKPLISFLLVCRFPITLSTWIPHYKLTSFFLPSFYHPQLYCTHTLKIFKPQRGKFMVVALKVACLPRKRGDKRISSAFFFVYCTVFVVGKKSIILWELRKKKRKYTSI